VHDREADLAMIDSVAERLAAGAGSVVVWLGEPGIGRSTLLRAATERIMSEVEGLHCINVSGRGVQGGPFAAVAFVIHQLLPTVPPIRSEPLDRLLRPGADEDPDPTELLRTAVQVVRMAARDRPLLITLDDGRLAEDGNWAAITSMAAQLAATRAAVLVTGGTRGSATAPVTSNGPLWARRLTALSPDAAVETVQESVPHFVPRSMAARLGRLLGGNPSALRDVCSALSRDELLGLVPLPDPLPADAATIEKYREWLRDLTPAQFTLVLAASLAVQPSASVAESVAGAEIADVPGLDGQPWARVRHDVVEFVDPRLRSAILKSATYRQVSQAHAALAEASTDPVAAVWHRGQLGEPLNQADIDLLTAAADEALDAGDHPTASRAAAQALAATQPGPRRAELALTAGTAAYHQTYVGLAATLLHDAVRDAGDPGVRHRALAALCLSVAARDGSAPYALVDAALGPLGEERPAEAASLACLVARIATDSQQLDLARGYLRQAELFAGTVGSRPSPGAHDEGAAARLSTELAHTRAWVGLARPGASGAIEHFSTVTTTRPAQDLTGWDLAVRQVLLLARAEDWGQARFALAEVENRQRHLSSRMVAAATAVSGLELHLAVGAVQEAHDIVAATQGELPVRMPFAGVGLCLVARVHILRDQTWAAQWWLEAARRFAQSTGSPAVLVRISAELALLATIRGDDEAAARLLGVAVQRASHFGHHDFAQLQLDLMEARHLAGLETRTDEVMPVLEHAWGRSEASSTQRGMLAAARLLAAPRERIVAAVLAAVDAAEWQTSPLWAGRVMRLAASVLGTLSSQEHEEQVRRLAVADVPPAVEDHQRSLLEKAAGLFRECGAIALATLTESVLASARGAGGDGDGSATTPHAPRLTPDEQRVAALVAGGASNRQVASTTYVSVRTVELRLTSIYRKLGIRSRKELADALIDRGLPILPHGGSNRNG
jgi:DNA-binding CsgD family transcriptional regulator